MTAIERHPGLIRPQYYLGATEAGAPGLKPANSMPRRGSGFCIKVFQTNSVLRFSAMSMVMPVSMPITSGSYHFRRGLKAFNQTVLAPGIKTVLSAHVAKNAQRRFGLEGQ